MSLFGTDGIRGLANGQVLTAELALDVAVAAAHILVESFDDKSQRPRAIVGQDSRASGEFLEAAVVAGLTSAGVDVYRVGVLPTPAISYLVASTGADLGVMISASHNAMPDNGIKLFARGGGKLDDSIEALVEARIGEPWERPTGRGVGRAINDAGAKEKYIEHLLTSLTTRLDGLKIVVDCANGAASFVAPDLLARAGATVIAISHTPDGWNINDNCGSTYLANLKAAVTKEGADFGIAHDGDADRCLAVGEDGSFIDGDQILAILAAGRKQNKSLVGNTVVATVMSNLGFTLAMQELDIKVIATAVGDRYVLEAMREQGFTLGGEQSGHVILSEFATTGDGVLTALHLLNEMTRTGKSATALANIVKRLPQILVNVKNVDKLKVTNSVLETAVKKAETELGKTGRVLLRPSGTEPLIRVMVEAATQELAQTIANGLAQVVEETCTL
jgi:phosphoglucosamine mutase